MYTAILLNKPAKEYLKDMLDEYLNWQRRWQKYCHHITLNMGPVTNGLNDPSVLNKYALAKIDAIGFGEKVVAARVMGIKLEDNTELKSTNKTPHITMAVNVTDGGKTVMSNDIKMWVPLKSQSLNIFCGKVVEIGT